jgi:hypothetical protein
MVPRQPALVGFREAMRDRDAPAICLLNQSFIGG